MATPATLRQLARDYLNGTAGRVGVERGRSAAYLDGFSAGLEHAADLLDEQPAASLIAALDALHPGQLLPVVQHGMTRLFALIPKN